MTSHLPQKLITYFIFFFCIFYVFIISLLQTSLSCNFYFLYRWSAINESTIQFNEFFRRSATENQFKLIKYLRSSHYMCTHMSTYCEEINLNFHLIRVIDFYKVYANFVGVTAHAWDSWKALWYFQINI